MRNLRTSRLLIGAIATAALSLALIGTSSTHPAPVAYRVTQQVSPTPSATSTLSPSPSPTPIQVNARNTVFGLLFLTACGAGGYFTAKWIRRSKRPRPPGPWFGGGGIRHTE
ncbi:MAG: hypothetical protein ACXVQS_10235 [Actinomycetota bacterium]